jgi:hypothetical protein
MRFACAPAGKGFFAPKAFDRHQLTLKEVA